jgi:hypothetical protein
MKGSTGLKTFFAVRWDGEVQVYIDLLKKREKFYQSIRPLYDSLDTQVQQIYNTAYKLKELYPSSIFPDIYLLVGMLNSGGTPSGGAGLLIGTELYSLSHTTDTTELNSLEKSLIRSKAYLASGVIHEYIHIQQKFTDPSNLLGQAIKEGSADFISELITGRNINDHLHAYGNKHEHELYELFKKDMFGKDYSSWLFNGSTASLKGIPADLGNYIGYKICESYYRKVLDKKAAIKEILEIQNFELFLNQSGYGLSFNHK